MDIIIFNSKIIIDYAKRIARIFLAFSRNTLTLSEFIALGLVTSTILFLSATRFIDFSPSAFSLTVPFSVSILFVVIYIKIKKNGIINSNLFLFLSILAFGFVNCMRYYSEPDEIRNISLTDGVLIKHEGYGVVKKRYITGRGKLVGIAKEGRVVKRFFNRNVIYNLPLMAYHVKPGAVTLSSGYISPLGASDRSVEENHSGFRNYLLSTNTVGFFYGYSKKTKIYRNPSYFRNLSLEAKVYIHRVFENLLPWPQSSFCEALITGNREVIPAFLSMVFKNSGTIHILAVSGLHVGILLGLLTLLLRLFSVNIRVSLTVGIIFISLYAAFIGNRVSVQRASLMGILGIIGFILDRDRNFLNILSLSFVVLWIFNPFFVYNPGFLLSFSSVLGIVLFAPYIQRFFKRFLNQYISGLLSSTLSVQVFIMPVMFYFFGEYAISNVIANLFLIPLVGLNLGLEILVLAVYPISIVLAGIISEVVTLIVTIIIYISYFFSGFPLIRIMFFPGFALITYFASILSITACFRANAFYRKITDNG